MAEAIATPSITPEQLAIAAKQLETVGFVTPRDIPEMTSREYMLALSDQVLARLHKDDDRDYIYAESFDYEDGQIAYIIWDMDKITTRQEAMQTLAKQLGLTVPKIIMRKIDEEVF